MTLVKITDELIINFDHVQRVEFSQSLTRGLCAVVDFDDSETSSSYFGLEANNIKDYCNKKASWDCTLPNDWSEK